MVDDAVARRSWVIHEMALTIQKAIGGDYLQAALQAEMAYLEAERNPRPVVPVVPASVAVTAQPQPTRTGAARFGAGDGRPKDGDWFTVRAVGARVEPMRRRS